MATHVQQLDSMLELKENWDGYGADAIDPSVVELAKAFLLLFARMDRQSASFKNVFVNPTRVGGVQIEWEDGTLAYEMEVNPDGSFGFLTEDKLTGLMTEKSLRPTRFVASAELIRTFSELSTA